MTLILSKDKRIPFSTNPIYHILVPIILTFEQFKFLIDKIDFNSAF